MIKWNTFDFLNSNWRSKHATQTDYVSDVRVAFVYHSCCCFLCEWVSARQNRRKIKQIEWKIVVWPGPVCVESVCDCIRSNVLVPAFLKDYGHYQYYIWPFLDFWFVFCVVNVQCVRVCGLLKNHRNQATSIINYTQ